ncbi:nitrate regulatory protein [Hydrogenophaga sp. BPS33]|uniref:nitrate regulatory protein n=1 Tax=Hydrogenophaga sp. BPS33 TaxID=2651974 RepID=UPI00131FA336|nr:nitrate regulatory protein [Hydrogenophaga sp. BPS33]QHE85432.1 ANTAR domain-containing protein [Hydrogenophaga sp. BPS33]
MKSGLSFLLAAKRCEIDELQQLALTSALVNVTGRLIHGLQRERGLSNLLIGSHGHQFQPSHQKQIEECREVEKELRACFDNLDTASASVGHGARLFSRIAYVLHGLDALDGLRERVASLQWTTRQSTDAYVRLISGLLAVVFEAADSASDPEISRLLVARFNFMQGKEFAGQERAAGSALFASGRADNAEQHRLLHLVESQERCLEVFGAFAQPRNFDLWQASQDSATLAELERLRRVLCTVAHGAVLDPQLSQAWFDCCSQRIDRMKAVEDRLALDLLRACEDKVALARDELSSYESLHPAATGAGAMSFFEDAPALGPNAPAAYVANPQGYGLQLERSILELVQEQARRLQNMSEELDTVRARLNERKVIERAKGLLMAHRQLSEEAAHKTMRQMAMNQNRRLIDVAEAVLSMAEVLPPR